MGPAAGTASSGSCERYEAANTAFQNGDPTLWLSLTAEKDPASIFGGFGGLGEAGVATVRQRYLLAAGAFRPSGAKVDFEYRVEDVRGEAGLHGGDRAADVLYAGHTELHQQVLRVTMIFRFERGRGGSFTGTRTRWSTCSSRGRGVRSCIPAFRVRSAPACWNARPDPPSGSAYR